MKLYSRVVTWVILLMGLCNSGKGVSEEIITYQHTLKQLLSHDTKSLIAWFEIQEEKSAFVLQVMKKRKNFETDVLIDKQAAHVAWIGNTKKSLVTKNELPEAFVGLGALLPDLLIDRIENESIRSSLIIFKTQGTIEPFLDTFYSLTKERDITEYVSCLGVVYTLLFDCISQATSYVYKKGDGAAELPSFLQSHMPLGTSASHATQQSQSQTQQQATESPFMHGVHVAVSLVSVLDEFNKLPIVQAIKTIASLIKEIKNLVQKIELQTGGNVPEWLKNNWVMIPFAVGIVIIRVFQYFLPLFSTYHKEHTNA